MRELIRALPRRQAKCTARGSGAVRGAASIPARPLRCEDYAFASFGMKLERKRRCLQYRNPVGGGPSSKRWPWWPPQRLQWYSVARVDQGRSPS